MPIKYNLTKYDMLFSRIKRITAKKGVKEMSKEERSTMFQAVLVAAFSSGHSWQTYKALTASSSANLRTTETRKEYEDAAVAKWRRISPFDINEVANANIQSNIFSEWLFFNVPKDAQNEVSSAWKTLQKEFSKDCDTAERIAYNR
jgi:hypothetical protein